MALPPGDQVVDQLTRQIRNTFARLGYDHTGKTGVRQEIVFKDRFCTENMVLLEVDTQRLPHGVHVRDLVKAETLHDLTAATHYPVRVLNTTGVTYVVLLQQVKRVELPKKVTLEDALIHHPGTAFTFPLGQGPSGPVWETLRGHYLVAGETGAGKTTWLQAAIWSLAVRNAPETLQMILVDPKGVDLIAFSDFPHLTMPVASTVEEATAAIAHLADEIIRRREAFRSVIAADLETYNERSVAPLPRIFAVVDEVTNLVLTAGLKSPLMRDLITVTSMGRSFGIHLVLATQNPKAAVIDTLVRENLGARVAFRVTTSQHSRTILGLPGAERLPRIPGRMLVRLGDGHLHVLQGYQVSQEDLALLGTHQVNPLATLPTQEKEMILYALKHLNGRFGQPEMMLAGFPRRSYRRLVEWLKRQELLYNNREDNNALYLASQVSPAWLSPEYLN